MEPWGVNPFRGPRSSSPGLSGGRSYAAILSLYAHTAPSPVTGWGISHLKPSLGFQPSGYLHVVKACGDLDVSAAADMVEGPRPRFCTLPVFTPSV